MWEKWNNSYPESQEQLPFLVDDIDRLTREITSLHWEIAELRADVNRHFAQIFAVILELARDSLAIDTQVQVANLRDSIGRKFDNAMSDKRNV